MSRKITSLLCVGFAIGALGLLSAKYQVKELKSELDAARKQLARESGQIHILEAEWAYLNRPENLSSLAAQHLPDFGAVKPSQVASLQTIKKSAIDGAPPP
ncbi:MAG: hypothetical protein CMM32_09845 [Rhodospirillaceae bacterium]|nr:hypothetical protein [Rhodospirillaceae bacterium]|tara:strand:+ start:182 stop:484 length:303 start_codon:yes stop_codon:yes gene_type:complete